MAIRKKDLDSQVINVTGGAGHSSAASSRSESNRNSLNSKTNPKRRSGLGSKAKIEPLEFYKPDADELEKLKSKIRQESRTERKKNLLIWLVVSVLLVMAALLIF